ncbi:unnamed protein product [Arctia plantaginis]|uniref:Uncharacterized protein n=1 Tax=Arctia plantaginis TaxID=874455 RepID=A0A8S1A6B2_ARCPL|nr:unnamed protein product [Arctia plantaginis]
MVKLPDPSEELVRAGAEQRSPYSWRYPRNRRQRTAYDTEPKGLIELDRLAVKAVKLMEKYCPESEANYYKVMDLLRLQYNLNFIVICEKCGGPHKVDELLAPER